MFTVHPDKAGNDWLLTDNGLGMIRPGDKEPVSYFTETKGKLSGMNQAFYAVQERDEDICFASDHGRVWVYQKGSGPPFIRLHRICRSSLRIRTVSLPVI